MNEQREFCLKIKGAVEELQKTPLPPDYMRNAEQYLSVEFVESLYGSHIRCNELISEFDAVLDIGSGINFYSRINPNVTTSNPCERGIGVQELYRFINGKLQCPVDVDLFDINNNDRWIDTEETFEAVIAHRFLPWHHKPFTHDTYKRFLRETHRVLRPGGTLFYYTNHSDIFFNVAGKERYIWGEARNKFFKTTKEKLSEVLE